MNNLRILPPKIRLNKNRIIAALIVLFIVAYYYIKVNILNSNLKNFDLIIISGLGFFGILLSLKNKDSTDGRL